MLINLTNHPFLSWSEKQYQAAVEQFGGVVDYDFPKITESMTCKDILASARKIKNDITKFYPESKSILVMGEHTFTYSVILELQKANFDCYATVSPRDVVEEKNNIKVSRFQFKKFRKYPNYKDILCDSK